MPSLTPDVALPVCEGLKRFPFTVRQDSGSGGKGNHFGNSERLEHFASKNCDWEVLLNLICKIHQP